MQVSVNPMEIAFSIAAISSLNMVKLLLLQVNVEEKLQNCKVFKSVSECLYKIADSLAYKSLNWISTFIVKSYFW